MTLLSPMSKALAEVLESATWLTETPDEAENVLIAALAALVANDERETLSLAVRLAKVIADHRGRRYIQPVQSPDF